MWKQWPRNAEPGLFELRANNLDPKPKRQQLRQAPPPTTVFNISLQWWDMVWCPWAIRLAGSGPVYTKLCVRRRVLDRERACECALCSCGVLKKYAHVFRHPSRALLGCRPIRFQRDVCVRKCLWTECFRLFGMSGACEHKRDKRGCVRTVSSMHVCT